MIYIVPVWHCANLFRKSEFFLTKAATAFSAS